MSHEKLIRRGNATRGGALAKLLEKHEAELCHAIIACDAQSAVTGKNVVLLVLGSEDQIPVAHAVIPCIHGIEGIINRLRDAARDAFRDQPCTICEKVE